MNCSKLHFGFPLLLLFNLTIFSVSCSKFSTREMFTDGNTNIGSGEPGPGDGPPGPNCGVAIVTWNKNTEADLAGYRIYYGLSPSTLSTQVQVSDISKDSQEIKNLTKNLTYHFAMTAYDRSGNESVRSKFISKKIETCPAK